MRVEFADRQLQRAFEDPSFAIRQWGPEVARKYALRINILLDSPTWDGVMSLRALRLHPLAGSRSGQWSMVVHGRWRLIVRPDVPALVRVEEVSNHYGD